ncbi:MAG: zinc ribbon domain-containing protein [Lachnospiraceae bacterium]|nr:zinc ribbon domain-containing protein [Lachnospiraceae bacterium]
MFCEKCGNKIEVGDMFCSVCGTSVEGASVTEESGAEAATNSDNGIGNDNAQFSDISEKIITETNAGEEILDRPNVNEPIVSNVTARQFENNLKNTQNNVPPVRLKSNGVATAFRIIGWFIVIVGVVAGIYMLASSSSKGSSSSAYSLLSGFSAGAGVISIVTGVISGLGFLGVGEIIQLLQDQKTIMLNNNQLLHKG